MIVIIVIWVIFSLFVITRVIALQGLNEYHLNGWNRACYFLKEMEEKFDYAESQRREMMKVANENAEVAEKYLLKLRKYGLEDL